MVAQQVMLLLPMFTFFREVSFVVVFMPLLAVVPFCAVWILFFGGIAFHIPFWAIFPIPSIVLLMLKADNLLGVGTAFLIGDAFPKFSWWLIMIPMWVLLAILVIANCFAIALTSLNED